MAEQPDPPRRRPADPDGEGAGWVDHDNPDEALVRRRRPSNPAPGTARPRRPAPGTGSGPDRPIRRPRPPAEATADAEEPAPAEEPPRRPRTEPSARRPRRPRPTEPADAPPEPPMDPPAPAPEPVPPAPTPTDPGSTDGDELLFEPFPGEAPAEDRPRRRRRRDRRARAAVPPVDPGLPAEAPPADLDPLAQDDPDIWTDDAPRPEVTAEPVPDAVDDAGEPLGWPATATDGTAAEDDDHLAPFPSAGDGEVHHTDARRTRVAVVVVAALVFGFVGYAIGWSRGSSGLTKGQSPTTLIIGGGSSGGVPGGTGTTQPPTTLALPGGDLTTVDFDGGIPRDVNGQAVDVPRGDWQVADGHAGPSTNDPIPADANGPRRYGQGPDLLFGAGKPVSQVDVKLVAPTVYSGVIGRFQDDGNYWAVVADRNLANISLVLVKDGQQTSKAFVTKTITPGMAIGFLDRDGQITITVDGQPQVLTDFFGTKSSIPDEGIQGTKVGLLAGEGQPQFDDLRFG